jgi:hypothetical protein
LRIQKQSPITTLVVVAALSACTTRMVPTKPISTIVGPHHARLAELTTWGSPAAALIDVDSPDEVGLMGVTVGTMSDACGTGIDLLVARAKSLGSVDAIDRVWDILVPQPAIDPRVRLPTLLARGTTRLKLLWPQNLPVAGIVDLRLRTLASQQPPLLDRCLRLQLPQSERAWKVEGSRLTAALGLGMGRPLSSNGGGPTGLDLGMEFGRVHGATRFVFRSEIGLATCGTECNLDPGKTSEFAFAHAGMGAGLEQVFVDAKNWSLGIGAGYRIRSYSGLSDDLENIIRHGPFATMRVLRKNPPPPGLIDPNVRGGYGVEFLLERVTGDAFGSGYRFGLGFVMVFQ